MQNFFIRSAILFFGVLIQISFLPGFFHPQNIPFATIAYAVAITVIREFNKALPWIIAMAVIFDLASFRIPGESVIPLILIAYVVSFISRKIWLTNKLLSWLAISALAGGGTAAAYSYYHLLQVVQEKSSFFGSLDIIFSNYRHVILSAAYTVVILYLIYWPLEKLENYLRFYERRTIIKR